MRDIDNGNKDFVKNLADDAVKENNNYEMLKMEVQEQRELILRLNVT